MKDELALRESLREDAFNRYKQWLAQAARGTIIVDPKTFPRPMKSGSFKVGVREAIRGAKLYGYKSNDIPFDFDYNRIKVQELKDGRIRLLNEYQDRMNTTKAVEDVKTVVVDVEGAIAHLNQKEKVLPENVRQESYSKELFTQWCEERTSGLQSNLRSELLWLLRLESPEQIKEMQATIKQYPHLDVEPLNHGWWRLHR